MSTYFEVLQLCKRHAQGLQLIDGGSDCGGRKRGAYSLPHVEGILKCGVLTRGKTGVPTTQACITPYVEHPKPVLRNASGAKHTAHRGKYKATPGLTSRSILLYSDSENTYSTVSNRVVQSM